MSAQSWSNAWHSYIKTPQIPAFCHTCYSTMTLTQHLNQMIKFGMIKYTLLQTDILSKHDFLLIINFFNIIMIENSFIN